MLNYVLPPVLLETIMKLKVPYNMKNETDKLFANFGRGQFLRIVLEKQSLVLEKEEDQYPLSLVAAWLQGGFS